MKNWKKNKFLNTKETADMFNVTERTVLRWLNFGYIKGSVHGSQILIYKKSANQYKKTKWGDMHE